MGKVLHSLNEWRRRREAPSGETARDTRSTTTHKTDPKFDAEIRSYCEKTDSLNAALPVAGFVTQLQVPIDIEDIYIPLHAMIDLRGVAEEPFSDSAHAEEFMKDRETSLEIPLPEAFRQSENRGVRGVVILGDPGSGKTTHLKRLLLWCLRNGAETIGLPEEMLPVFLPLRDLMDLDRGFEAFIEDQLANPHLSTPDGFGERLLKRGNLLLLLDGLDEVADLSRREQMAEWIVTGLKAHPTCRFVVTCRFAGYSPTVRLSHGFLETHIRPLSAEQASRFVRNWYKIVEKGLARDPGQAEGIALEKAEHLINRLKEPDFRARRVFELTRNPLLLANICLVHRHRGGLPHKRARLYEECIDILLEHWREAKGLRVGVTAREGRRALQPAALWLHGEEGRTRAEADELIPRIDPVLKAMNWPGGSARDFLHTIRDESGLLTGWDQEHYGFMHLGFQEYLAAREIRSRAFDDPGVLSELAAHFGESWWREVGLLMLALEDPSLFKPYMREVLKQPAFIDNPVLFEACLDDASETSTLPFLEFLEAASGKDPTSWKHELVALRLIERLDPSAAKRLRSRLSRHPSPEIRGWVQGRSVQEAQDVIVVEKGGYELVKIPGGVFRMGSPKNEKGHYNYESPLHEVRASPFYIGRYPVTNEEYGRFLRENPDAPDPKYWADSRFNKSMQPVVGVSWEDARLYAKWSGLRLPTEAEWEYACRAGTTTRYYTGNSDEDLHRAAWYSGNSGGRPNAVGEKEPNEYGLYDIHGNVWEWVEDDWHENYKGAPADGGAWVDSPRGAFRVFRGGSWFNSARYCRSAIRGNDSPDFRVNNLGFRLSRSLTLGPLTLAPLSPGPERSDGSE